MKWLSNYLTDFPRAPDGGAGGAAAGADGGGAGAGAGGGAGAAKPWFDGKLDAELIGHIENKGWKKDDPISVAIEATKAHRELQKHFGVPETQLLKLPKDAADEAGWKAVNARLGVPADIKGYDLSTIKHADGRALDTALADSLRTSMLNAAVRADRAPDIAKAVVKHMDDQAAAKATERTAAAKTQREDLIKEWGPNFELNRLTAMQGAKRAAGTDEGAQKLVAAMEDAVGYKATMEFWRKIGKGTTEDTFVEGGTGGSPTTQTGAVARKAELEADTAWRERYLKGGAAEVREMNNLLAIITEQAA